MGCSICPMRRAYFTPERRCVRIDSQSSIGTMDNQAGKYIYERNCKDSFENIVTEEKRSMEMISEYKCSEDMKSESQISLNGNKCPERKQVLQKDIKLIDGEVADEIIIKTRSVGSEYPVLVQITYNPKVNRIEVSKVEKYDVIAQQQNLVNFIAVLPVALKANTAIQTEVCNV